MYDDEEKKTTKRKRTRKNKQTEIETIETLEEKVVKESKFKLILKRLFRKRKKRLLNDLDRLMNKVMWYEIIASAVMIIFGLIFLINPTTSTKAVSILFGLGVIASSAIAIYEGMKRRDLPFFKYFILYGVLGLIVGLLAVLSPFTFSQIVTVFVGLWMICQAITKIDFGLRLKIISENAWLFLILSSVLQIFMAILIFINPFSNLLITQIVGAYLVLNGVMNATNSFLTKNRAYYFMENI